MAKQSVADLTDPTDEDLYARWAAGDAQAGHGLFTRYYARLYAFFAERAGDDVEDLIQRTMLACQEAAPRFGGQSRFATFLFGIARNKVFEHYRAQCKRGLHFDPEAQTQFDLGATPSAVLAHGEERQLVLAAMRGIPVDDAVLLNLYVVVGLTAPQLCELWEVNEPAMRGRLRRAKQRLKKAVLELAASPEVARRTTTDLESWLASLPIDGSVEHDTTSGQRIPDEDIGDLSTDDD